MHEHPSNPTHPVEPHLGPVSKLVEGHGVGAVVQGQAEAGVHLVLDRVEGHAAHVVLRLAGMPPPVHGHKAVVLVVPACQAASWLVMFSKSCWL